MVHSLPQSMIHCFWYMRWLWRSSSGALTVTFVTGWYRFLYETVFCAAIRANYTGLRELGPKDLEVNTGEKRI